MMTDGLAQMAAVLVGVAMGASVATAGFGLRERLRRSGMSWPLVVGLVMILAAVVRTLTAEPSMPHPPSKT
jgi:uncharacterized membrane protein (UPF0136 family)